MTRRMASGDYRDDAWERRYEAHVEPINRYVETLRQPDPPAGRGWVPYVHAVYGGVDAHVLELLRDPGPKTHPDHGGSGFLSWENDDASAELMSQLVEGAGLLGRDVAWNTYPW